MSRRIKSVQLAGNTLFKPATPGGMSDQRTDFTAGPNIRLSIDRELGGVYVEKGEGPSAQAFTIMPGNISHIEWVMTAKEVKEPPKDAA